MIDTENIKEIMKKNHAPGVQIAVINDFNIEWTNCYGFIDANSKKRVTPDTIFEAGSATKALTAVTVLHYVDAGELSLDTHVNNVLRSWKIPDNNVGKGDQVQLHHLLTHTAGINLPDGGFTILDNSIPTLPQVLNGEIPAVNDPVSFIFTPGSNHCYSNFGYVILQLLLEDVTGTPFDHIVKDIIFHTIGMESSTFNQPLPPELKENAATPHDENGTPQESEYHPRALAQGGLWTTSKDLALFTREIMKSYHGKSNKIISKSLVHQMVSPHYILDPEKAMSFTAQGLGFFLSGKGKDLLFAHPGLNVPGATSILVGFPERGEGASIMTNSIHGLTVQTHILNELSKEYGWPHTFY
ncbi:MAG: serine hydrolase domain-containing protein [Candidatus Methanofastidiosia archaeon]|jgi:CubicO group peptidase (beta-lactamase class C family)